MTQGSYTALQVAIELGLSTDGVRKLAQRGVLVGTKSGGRYKFSKGDLDQFRQTYGRELAAYADRDRKVRERFVNFECAEKAGELLHNRLTELAPLHKF